MTPEMKCTSNRSVDENPLCTTGSISLDLNPVVQAITSLGSGMRKESVAYRKQAGELAMLANATSNDIIKIAKLILGLQRGLQSLEEEQRKISEQNIRARFMKPLARKLLGLRASAAELMDQEDFIYIANAIDDLLGDFDIEIIEPEPGDQFAPQSMKPRVGGPERKTSDLVVQELLLPGARYGDYLLEFAQVKLIDRIDYVNPCARQEGLSFPIFHD